MTQTNDQAGNSNGRMGRLGKKDGWPSENGGYIPQTQVVDRASRDVDIISEKGITFVGVTKFVNGGTCFNAIAALTHMHDREQIELSKHPN